MLKLAYPVSDGGASGSVLHFFRVVLAKKVRTDPAPVFSAVIDLAPTGVTTDTAGDRIQKTHKSKAQ